MKLNAALDFFKDSLQRTDRKSESKVYKGFIGILSNLSDRALDDQQLDSIEVKLDALDLSAITKNRKNT